MDSKSFLASKTLWANVIMLIGALAASQGVDLGLTPEVQASLVAAIMFVVNVVLRFVTKKAVHVTAPAVDSSKSGDANAITPAPKGD